MTDTDRSLSFATVAKTGTASYPLGGGTPTFGLAGGPAEISFDADTGDYTVTRTGRSATFKASDLDPSQSDDRQSTFKLVSGTTTDFLTITRSSLDGKFTYDYVGSAFWQRSTEGETAINGSLDAIVFGFPTDRSAIPSGGGVFDISVLGAVAQPMGVAGFTGDGELLIDFVSGGLFLDAALFGSGLGNGFIQGNGRLSSNANEFSGFLTVNFFDRWSGPFDGRLYGPNAEELGATFFGRNSADGSVTSGTFMGRRRATDPNESFRELTSSQVFSGSAQSVAFNPGDKTGPATEIELGERSEFRVGYITRQGGLYNFYGDDRVRVKSSPDDYGFTNGYYLEMRFAGKDGGWLRYDFLEYLKPGRFVTIDGDRWQFDEFIFGFDTHPSALRTGSAGYLVNLGGSALLVDRTPFPISGSGNIKVDFAAGTLVGTGAVSSRETNQSIGTWNGTAAITSGTSDFSGDWTSAGDNGLPDFSGSWAGGFYGPTADEVGATFGATAADGSVLSGVIFGKRDDSIVADFPTLDQIDVPTVFRLSRTAVVEEYQFGDYSTGSGIMQITYDPDTGTYQFAKDPLASNFARSDLKAAFTDSDFSASESDASYLVYRNENANMRLLNFASVNPVIDLSYVSFAEVAIRQKDFADRDLTARYWTVFGNKTPNETRPRSGTANYSGVATGGGYVQGYGENASVNGDFTMSVNFGTLDVTGALSLTVDDRADALTAMDLGSFELRGQTMDANFSGVANVAGYTSVINGGFFGPNAEEIGGQFGIRRSDSGTAPGLDIVGIFVGKQDATTLRMPSSIVRLINVFEPLAVGELSGDGFRTPEAIEPNRVRMLFERQRKEQAIEQE